MKDTSKMSLRHVGTVVKDLRTTEQMMRYLGFNVIERERIYVVKMGKLEDGSQNIFELVKGKWKPHIAVNFVEGLSGYLAEVVCLKCQKLRL